MPKHLSSEVDLIFPGNVDNLMDIAGNVPIVILPRPAFTASAPGPEIQLMLQVMRITIHHAGFQEPWLFDDQSTTAEHLEFIRRFHTDPPPQGRGWADIGYHFAIDRAGRVWQGRSLSYQGAHVRNHNGNNLGIVVLGNFDIQQPPLSQIESLKSFIALLRKLYAIPSMEIWGHCELADEPTSCPGEHLLDHIGAIRGF